MKKNDQGLLVPLHNKEMIFRNRQEQKPIYRLNGAIYVCDRKLIYNGSFYGENTFPYIMSRKASLDIDTELDFQLADFLLKNQYEDG